MDSRYDICTCRQCRLDILKDVTGKIPPLNLTLPPEELEQALKQIDSRQRADINHAVIESIRFIGNNPRHAVTEDRHQALKALIRKILRERSVDFRNYRMEILKRRFALRIRANNLRSYADYMRFLTKTPKEYDKLFETLCINVSEFYRDPPVWVTLQYLFENLIRINANRSAARIRIWSAGCANGEEAYSIAILLKELQKTSHPFEFEIIATDIDKASMSLAQKGFYPKEAVKNLEKKLLSKYFIPMAEGYQVKSEIKKMVDIRYLDLTSQDFLQNIDVILCRNVFIYFNTELQEKILNKFHEALNPGGYLVLGLAESMVYAVRKLFEDIDSNARIYKKSAEA
jgi:two-component system CheB/CheR fusion protein